MNSDTSSDVGSADLNSMTELPLFPAIAPDVFSDPDRAGGLVAPVLEQLEAIVDVPANLLDGPTPCLSYTVAELRVHVLAWLQFFADALNDPAGRAARIDTETWALDDRTDPAAVVRSASARVLGAITDGVADQIVVMSQARMHGSAIIAMALGEYIVHGWDLAVATGRPWVVEDDAASNARVFLEGTVAPEYRGEESGFFGDEVAVADTASALDKLLGFGGRDPKWRRPA